MNVLIFFLPMFLLFNKTSAPQQPDITQIEFNTSTRGYNKTIIVTEHTFSVSEQTRNDVATRVNEKKIDEHDWRKILESKNILLEKIAALKSPTSLRSRDAARASTLTITDVNGKTYSHSFDNENPNEKLRPLMFAVLDLEHHIISK